MTDNKLARLKQDGAKYISEWIILDKLSHKYGSKISHEYRSKLSQKHTSIKTLYIMLFITTQSRLIPTKQKQAFENIVGKGEKC